MMATYPPLRFDGQVALVTGASRGIGKATALALARAGASVVVTARPGAPSAFLGTLEQTLDELKAIGGRHQALAADLRDEAALRGLIRQALSEFGGVDMFVNNAAISAPAPFIETPLKRYDLIMEVNVRGPVILLQELLPAMVARGGGRLVHVSSYLPVTQTVPGQSIYSMSKMALENLSDWIARELDEQGIVSNVLCIDRNIATEGWRLHNPDKDYAGHGWESPEAAAEAILWMLRREPPAGNGLHITIGQARDQMRVAGMEPAGDQPDVRAS